MLLDRYPEECRDDGVRLQVSESRLTWPLADDDIKIQKVPEKSDTVGENADIHTTEWIEQPQLARRQNCGVEDTFKKEKRRRSFYQQQSQNWEQAQGCLHRGITVSVSYSSMM